MYDSNNSDDRRIMKDRLYHLTGELADACYEDEYCLQEAKNASQWGTSFAQYFKRSKDEFGEKLTGKMLGMALDIVETHLGENASKEVIKLKDEVQRDFSELHE